MAALAFACGDDDRNVVPLDPGNPTSGTSQASSSDGEGESAGETAGTDASGSSTGESGSGSSTGPEVPTNCGELQCSNHGSCVVDSVGTAACICDEGYRFDQDLQTCTIDESCIKVRFLEDHCRQIANGAPAVALFFGVDFCAGVAVTPERQVALGLQFQVLENGNDVGSNVESHATIIEKDVENYVMLVLDVSRSVAENKDLPALVAALRAFVASLEPAPGDAPVYVSLTLFGRFVREQVPFTTNLTAVDTTLAEIQADPGRFGAQVGIDGSALFEATKEGIENTQRIRELRDVVTDQGVLTTGTVVVVTDGKDQSNGMPDAALLGSTLNQVISVGIGTQIDDEQLRLIGRDGSFLAPTSADWQSTFEEIATRVDEYPDRAYLLGYCSPATTGRPTVEVTVDGPGLSSVTSSVCEFDAEKFGSNPLHVCSTELFEHGCDARQCGGLTACGGCSDDRCCADGACQGPTTTSQVNLDCEGQSELCSAVDQTCNSAELECTAPAELGAPCAFDVDCRAGEGWCFPDPVLGESLCLPTLPNGMLCERPAQCASQNCYYANPENETEGRRCLPQARVFDHCAAEDAFCEIGAFCEGSSCATRKVAFETCNNDYECREANCVQSEAGNFCVGPLACYWTWDQKVAQ